MLDTAPMSVMKANGAIYKDVQSYHSRVSRLYTNIIDAYARIKEPERERDTEAGQNTGNA